MAKQVNAAYEAAGKMQTGQQPANLDAQKQEQPAPIRENTVANSNQSFAEKALAKIKIKNNGQPNLKEKVPIKKAKDLASSSISANISKKGNDETYAEYLLKTGIRTIKRAKKKNGQAKKEKESAKKERKVKGKDGFSQDYIPIHSIHNGAIHLTNGRWIRIIEISPINFYEKTYSERNSIIDTFTTVFRICPRRLQFKCVADRADPTELIENVRARAKKSDLPEIIAQREDYIQKIINISNNASLSKRFFIIVPYEGKQKDPALIAEELKQIEDDIASVLARCGNYISIRSNNDNEDCLQKLYFLLNRKSYRMIPYEYRNKRILSDVARYNRETGEKKKVNDLDIISTRGIDSMLSSSMLVDGQYYTWLVLKENGHPSAAYAGWLDLFSFGEYVDTDFYINRLPRESTLRIVEQYTRNKKVSARENSGNSQKYEEKMIDVNNNLYVTRKMRNEDEDLFEVAIILTIRANSIKVLMQRRDTIQKHMQARQYYTEDTYLNAEQFYKMTLPFLMIDRDIFSRCKRNYLTSSLSSLYPFTSPELYDPNGFMIGVNQKNGTLTCINNFNTHRYKNANMAIFGTSGAGKTFTEQTLAYGMLFAGIRTFFILPAKGYEYIPGCQNVGGTYIKLAPAASTCLNIMEIRPEADIDNEFVEENLAESKTSLLTKKVNSIIVFIQLLMGNETMELLESNTLNTYIVSLYNSFGITNDNASIYQSPGVLKKMPIIGDLYNILKDKPKMARIASVLQVFVSGTCQNMNGQTNISLDNRYTVFDIDESDVPEELLPAFLYIAFDAVYDIVKSSRVNFDAVFMDEVWKMMGNEAAAKQVQRMVKLIRGYAGCVILATQDIHDFLGNDKGFGVAVLNNTELKLFLNLKDDECKRVAALIDLDQETQKRIRGFQRGQGMLISNGDKVFVDIKASNHEVLTFTTDANIIRKKMNIE